MTKTNLRVIRTFITPVSTRRAYRYIYGVVISSYARTRSPSTTRTTVKVKEEASVVPRSVAAAVQYIEETFDGVALRINIRTDRLYRRTALQRWPWGRAGALFRRTTYVVVAVVTEGKWIKKKKK